MKHKQAIARTPKINSSISGILDQFDVLPITIDQSYLQDNSSHRY